MANMNSIQGKYFSAGISRGDKALLSGSLDRLFVQVADHEGVMSQPMAVEFRSATDRIGSVPRKLTFQDGAVFETYEDDWVDSLVATDSGFWNWLNRAEASWRWVAACAVLGIFLIYGLFAYGLPAAANIAAKVTPEIVLSAMDRGSFETVDRTLFSPTKLDSAKQERVSKLFDEIVAASDLVSPKPTLNFRDGGKIGPNAFALPGGTVVITDQLIELAKNDDEIAGVLAHELGHVRFRHSLKQIYRILGIGFAVTIVVGDASQLIDEAATQLALLQNFSYSRQFETESDAYSVSVMKNAKRDPIAFVDLLERIGAEFKLGEEKTGWLSTHPSTEDRRGSVEALIAE